MTEKIDEGEVIKEQFLGVSGKNEIEIYNQLYPLYSIAIVKSLKKLKSSLKK
jgi:hypothetical protein